MCYDGCGHLLKESPVISKYFRPVALCVLLVCSSLVLAQSSILPTLQALRKDYPVSASAGFTPALHGEYLNRVAWHHRADGWGLLRKPGGNRCPSPQGVDVSCDFLVHRPTLNGYDVLINEDTEARPNFPSKPSDNFTAEPDRWLAPIDPGVAPIPTPDPTPTPVPGPPGPQGPAGPSGPQGPQGEPGAAADVSALIERLNELEAWRASVSCSARVFGIPISCSITR
jgi:hypothetical protein